MIRKIAIVIALCLIMMIATAWPLPLFQLGPQQETVQDAVQNEKLARSEADIARIQSTMAQMDSKINYMLGGVAGIYAIIAIVGVINAMFLRKRG